MAAAARSARCKRPRAGKGAALCAGASEVFYDRVIMHVLAPFTCIEVPAGVELVHFRGESAARWANVGALTILGPLGDGTMYTHRDAPSS